MQQSQFQLLFPFFEQTLLRQYPELNENDLLYCKLIKLGLPDDIKAQLLNIATRSIYKRRKRVLEKMNLPDKETSNIADYLPNI